MVGGGRAVARFLFDGTLLFVYSVKIYVVGKIVFVAAQKIKGCYYGKTQQYRKNNDFFLAHYFGFTHFDSPFYKPFYGQAAKCDFYAALYLPICWFGLVKADAF